MRGGSTCCDSATPSHTVRNIPQLEMYGVLLLAMRQHRTFRRECLAQGRQLLSHLSVIWHERHVFVRLVEVLLGGAKVFFF